MIHIEMANHDNTPTRFHERMEKIEADPTKTGFIMQIKGNSVQLFQEMVSLLYALKGNPYHNMLFTAALEATKDKLIEPTEVIDLMKEVDA